VNSEIDNNQSLKAPIAIRQITQIALYTAAAVACGYLLIGLPNVELVSGIVALSGLSLGSWSGALVGVFSEAIFSGLNPYGLPFPPVWAAQMLGMAGTVFLFGKLRKLFDCSPPKTRIFISVAGGIAGTLLFDLLTNLAFPIAMGVKTNAWGVYLLAALPFSAVHLAANAVVFAVIVPVAFDRLKARI